MFYLAAPRFPPAASPNSQIPVISFVLCNSVGLPPHFQLIQAIPWGLHISHPERPPGAGPNGGLLWETLPPIASQQSSFRILASLHLTPHHGNLSLRDTDSGHSTELACLHLPNHSLVVGYLCQLYFVKRNFRPNSFHFRFPDLRDAEVASVQCFRSPVFAESVDSLELL